MPHPLPPQARDGVDRDPSLLRLDAALMRLRRLWDAPAGVVHRGAVVDGSTLLVCLALSAHRAEGEAGVVEVASALGVTQSTASRLVAKAVETGTVARSRSVRDPRRAALTLTDDGTDLVDASRAHRADVLGRCLESWPHDDVVALAGLVSRFADAVSGGGPPLSTPPGRP